MESTRSRSWCFTINNYTPDDAARLEAFKSKFIIYAPEVGESGTPHLQGYVETDNAMTLSAMKKKLHPTAHFEPAKGTAQENISYIQGPYDNGHGKTKPINPDVVSCGEPKNQGKRSDLNQLKNEIVSGKKVDEIVMETPMLYHQYGRTLHKIEDIHKRTVFRTFTTLGEWHYGPTGTGKSEYAFNGFDPATHYVWKYDHGWQDSYSQQDTVIIDEFRGQIPMSELLTMIDKHPNHEVRRRGRETLYFVSKKVIITSSLHPKDVYTNLAAEDKLDQLLRRIEIIEHKKKF